MLLVGVGEPASWELPPRASLLTLESLPSTPTPAGFHPPTESVRGQLAEAAMHVGRSNDARPHTAPRGAALCVLALHGAE
eukprot:3417496-Prymnesium_polylepis.1